DIAGFFKHMLERVDWSRDLHFQTQTSMDTLDYSGTGLNSGSKVVIAAAGEKKRELGSTVPGLSLPDGFGDVCLVMPGVLALRGPSFPGYGSAPAGMEKLTAALETQQGILENHPLIILCDDPDFVAARLDNFLWTTFTRSNPSHDVYGLRSFTEFKHWGCRGSLIIDARSKPHHAPPLEQDPAVEKRIDRLFAAGGSLHGIG
ncbi:MAG: 3-octaprenyl-4-hydroxybenzoate carboxy-lyase UbiD, partial [Bacteroidetes bacterium]